MRHHPSRLAAWIAPVLAGVFLLLSFVVMFTQPRVEHRVIHTSSSK